MRKSIFTVFCVLLIIFLFPEKVDAGDKLSIYYFISEGDSAVLESEEFEFVGEFTAEQKAIVLFTNLTENPGKKVELMPEGARLLEVRLEEDGASLILSMSREFLNYGGTEYELHLVRQMAETAAGLPGVKKLTILIENNPVCLTEGLFVNKSILNELLGDARP